MKTNEIYEMVTDRITKELEKGNIPWTKPWTGAHSAYSRATGKSYSLLNQWLMPEGEYATFNQVKKEGGNIIKGSKGYPVVFWKIYKKDEIDPDTGDLVEVNIPCLKYYTVFNVETQTTLEKKHNRIGLGDDFKPIETAETVRRNYTAGAHVHFIENEGDRAYYSPMDDVVVVPCKGQFMNEAEYYSTVFHELGHSTGHESRLARGLESSTGFGSESYSREELVAELTSCGILANLGIETKTSFRNNAAYIQSWLHALKDDPKMIVWASGRAEKAYDLIMGYTDLEAGAESPAEEEAAVKPETPEKDYQVLGASALKKGEFYRSLAGGELVLTKGYTCTLTDGKEFIEIGIAKNPNKADYWDITETHTGLLLLPHCFKTRQEAYEAAKNLNDYSNDKGDTYFEKVYAMFGEPRMIELANKITLAKVDKAAE